MVGFWKWILVNVLELYPEIIYGFVQLNITRQVFAAKYIRMNFKMGIAMFYPGEVSKAILRKLFFRVTLNTTCGAGVGQFCVQRLE